jgi:hypothetical protein
MVRDVVVAVVPGRARDPGPREADRDHNQQQQLQQRRVGVGSSVGVLWRIAQLWPVWLFLA